MTDIATLGLKVDSSQVSETNRELDKMSSSAGKAEKAMEGVGKASESAAAAVEKNAAAVTNAATRLAGLDPRLRSVANVLTHVSGSFVAVAGISAAAGAVALLTKAYIEGAREQETFAKAIFLTGNASGLTTGQLAQMAARLDNVAGTQHAAAEALATFVETGKVGADNLERFTALAQKIERDVGTPIAETAKQFASLADSPTKAAAELQKQFNFLTPAVFNYIRAQEEAGNVTEAAAAAQNAYAGAAERALKQVDENIPPIVKGWRAIKDAAKEAWDEILGIGRNRTPEEQLAQVQEQLKKASAGGRFGQDLFSTGGGNDNALRDEETRLQAIVDDRKREAESLKDLKDRTDAYVQSQKNATESAEEFRQAQARIDQAWRAFDVSKIQRDLATVESAFANATNELEENRAANIVTEENYYKKRHELIQQQTAAEVTALRAESAVLSQQNDLSAVERVAAQAKIAANTQRIVEIRARTASQLRVLDTQEADSLHKTAVAYADAQASADRYVDSLTKRFQIESQGLGLGNEARQRLRDEADLQDRFRDRSDQIERDRRRGDITEEQYRKLLAIEEDALKRSEAAYDDHYKVLKEKQGSWLVGAQEAFANFRDSAANVADQVDAAFSKLFDGLADSLVQFATTGKINFKQLVNSFLADLLRIEIKIIESKVLKPIFEQLGNSISGLFTSTPTAGGGAPNTGVVGPRATGGPVKAGSTYLVNEDTPRSEYFTPAVDGFITPANGMAGGGGGNVNAFFSFGAGASVATVQAHVERGMAELRNEIYQNFNRGRWKRLTG